ncbi:MAG: hypothetical protein M3O34_06235 [Chloroflexota bacterium]|nr:hypothetical protein [Chloroflexota bacterium]
MSMNQQQLVEAKDTYLQMMEAVPTQVYLGAALGSIGLSAFLRLLGYKDAAIFVGQWPPTFLLMAMAHKILRPSQESGFHEGQEAVRQASNLVGSNR